MGYPWIGSVFMESYEMRWSHEGCIFRLRLLSGLIENVLIRRNTRDEEE